MKTFLAIPTVSNLHINPHPRLVKWTLDNGLKPHFVDNYMPQWVARKVMAKIFLEMTNADDLLMIDYDTIPTFQFNYMYSLAHPKRIVAGHYAMFSDLDLPMFQWSVGKKSAASASSFAFTPTIPEGVSFWDVCGFGCALIPRRLVEYAWSDGLFDEATPPGMTEDTPLCDFWRRHCDAEIMTSHLLTCEHWRTMNLSAQLKIQTELIGLAELPKRNG